MGNERKTSKSLRVVRIDADENLLLVRGAVPGPAGSYILIRKAKTAQSK
jgi:large subunit ribosomal protein L3